MWALGSALFANMVAFLGISYFDQTMVAWYGLLAMISAATVVRSKKALSQVQFLAAAPSEAQAGCSSCRRDLLVCGRSESQ